MEDEIAVTRLCQNIDRGTVKRPVGQSSGAPSRGRFAGSTCVSGKHIAAIQGLTWHLRCLAIVNESCMILVSVFFKTVMWYLMTFFKPDRARKTYGSKKMIPSAFSSRSITRTFGISGISSSAQYSNQVCHVSFQSSRLIFVITSNDTPQASSRSLGLVLITFRLPRYSTKNSVAVAETKGGGDTN